MGAITHNGEVLQRLPANASQINFDNTGTNLNSTQTENAIKEVNTKVNTLQSEKADTDIVASDFSTATSYTAGDYCIYEGKFYKFKVNHSGAWVAADVDEIKIAGELASLRSGLIKRARITDTTSSAGLIGTSIDFARAVSAMCISGYDYYLNIRESSIGKAVVFAYELEDGYQSLKPLLNTEIAFDILYI